MTLFWTIAVTLYVISWLLIPHVLLAKKRPASTLAWIWAILLFPFAGALVYIFTGSERMTRKRLRRAKKLNLTRHSGHPGVLEKIERESPGTAAMLRALANINEIPPSTVADVRLLVDACEFYPALKERISEAQHHDVLVARAELIDELGLDQVGVLVFVDENELKLTLITLGDFRVIAQEPHGFFEQIIKVHGICRALARFILGLRFADLRRELEKVWIFFDEHLFDRAPRIHREAEDVGEDFPFRKTLFLRIDAERRDDGIEHEPG